MSEAGRLGELQAGLRAEGVPVGALLAPYESSSFGDPDPQEALEFADRYIDAEDPDANYPIITTTEAALAALMPWGDDHPKHCVITPDREIAWCENGYGLEDDFQAAVLDLWASR